MAKSTDKPMEKEFTSVVVRDKNGTPFTLEFNRRGVEAMERGGFKFDMDAAPQTSIRDLFRGAFRMHHRGITPERVDEIWEVQKNKEGLVPVLYRLYLQPLNDLMAEPEGTGDENPTWETI